MFTNAHLSVIVNPSLNSYRLLYDSEKQTIENNNKLYSISVKNLNCVSFGAKVGDIICIKTYIANIYRKVID